MPCLVIFNMAKRYWVYFFEVGDTLALGQCKGNFNDRKYNYQTHSPYPVKLLGVIECETEKEMRNLEKTLIRRFSEHNLRGEWFSLADEILTYIQEHADYELGQQALKEGKERNNQYQREYRQIPENRKREQEAERKRYKERYQNDLEYREHIKERQREYWKNNPEYRESQQENNNKRRRERYQNDLEYRERQKKKSHQYRARKKAERLAQSGQSQQPEQLQLPINDNTQED